jgi:hypothetical protein
LIETEGTALVLYLNGRELPMIILDSITGTIVTIDTSSRPLR